MAIVKFNNSESFGGYNTYGNNMAGYNNLLSGTTKGFGQRKHKK